MLECCSRPGLQHSGQGTERPTAKMRHKQLIEDNFSENNSHTTWQGMKTIIDYKQNHSTPTPTDTSLPDKLNMFFAQFEVNSRQEPHMPMTTSESDQPLTLQPYQVLWVLCNMDTKKAPEPDEVTRRVLKTCASQLPAVFTTIFNRSLQSPPASKLPLLSLCLKPQLSQT